MLFYVHAADASDVQDQMVDQAEEHWSYMDGFADRLVLRGPTLSEDGELHTGSVHVVDVADRAAAELFATQEPYWRSGLYREFRADRIVVERHEKISGDEDMTLVTAHWDARPRAERELYFDAAEDELVFYGLLVDDAGESSTGSVAVLRTLSDEDVRAFTGQLAAEGATVTAQRWCRGGRN